MFDIKAKIRYANGHVATVYVTNFAASNRHEAEATYKESQIKQGNNVLLFSITEK